MTYLQQQVSRKLTKEEEQKLIDKNIWHKGCPIKTSNLMLVEVQYYNFSQELISAQLITHEDAASSTVKLFEVFLETKFPLAYVSPLIENDLADAIATHNSITASFNCRSIVGKQTWSIHSFGFAIDINSLQNPYYNEVTNKIIPPEGVDYLDRSIIKPGILEDMRYYSGKYDSLVNHIINNTGYKYWGGHWRKDLLKKVDYMHFEHILFEGSPAILKAIYEERERRIESYQELDVLYQYVKLLHHDQHEYELQDKAKRLIDTDIDKQLQLNNQIRHLQYYFALTSNKNLEIFRCAQDVLNDQYQDLFADNYLERFKLYPYLENEIFNKETNNGSSMLNCLSTALLAIARLLDYNFSLSINFIGKFYDHKVSPVIQGVVLPDNICQESYLQDWLFFVPKERENDSKCLLLEPNLGYAFGGSRNDMDIYSDKRFKMEDCSSAVAKWTKAPGTFTTLSMIKAHQNLCEQDKMCENVLSVMKPIKQDSTLHNINVGDIYVEKGHTGIVYRVEGDCFIYISYTRDVTRKEGFVYDEKCLSKVELYFFQENTYPATYEDIHEDL